MEKIIFAIKIALWFVIVLVFCFVVVMPQYSTGYNAALIDKWDRLKSIDEPKIILVGDSNVAFGFDSQKIQEAFDMPVVNFGLHAGLGQAFHSDMIKPYISEGDIVVIAPCAYDDSSTQIPSPSRVLAWTAIENHICMLRAVSPKHCIEIIKGFPMYFRRVLDLWYNKEGNLSQGDTSYKRTAFNEYGDNIIRPHNSMRQEGYDTFFNSRYLSEIMKIYWNKYNDYAEIRNARVFMSCPPISLESLPDDIDLESLQKQLEEELEFPVISRLQDYLYPPEYFYDTYFHLNDVGVAIRTEQLITDLKAELSR